MTATLKCISPIDGAVFAERPVLSQKNASAIVVKARKAQASWASRPLKERVDLVMAGVARIGEMNDEVVPELAWQMGRPVRYGGEFGGVNERASHMAAIASEALASVEPGDDENFRRVIKRVPQGVVFVVAPWNYPFHNMLNHVISGIFSGNAVVSKVSEHTSWSSTYFGKICRMALEVNGHDPDLVQTVTGFGESGAALVACDDVDKIIFTGSPGVGRKVMEGASKYLKPVILELGGKDPMVFCDDVKIKDVVPWAMRGCRQRQTGTPRRGVPRR